MLENLKLRRRQALKSQKDMAAVLGIGQSNYAQIELGRRELRVSELAKLARALNCRPEDLVDLETAPPEKQDASA